MALSDKVKGIIALVGKQQQELAQFFGMSKQVMNNKIARNSWSGKDLLKVAEFVGGQLAIILPDGQKIVLDDDQTNA